MSDNKWDRLNAPPPPMFTGRSERDFVKQINDEVAERIIGQQLLYYPIDIDATNFDDVYGEASVKTFMPPIQCHALIEFGGSETRYEDDIGLDKQITVNVYFQKRRLTEDKNLHIREGDYILYGDQYYKIVNVKEPDELFGQAEHHFAVFAECIMAREGDFDAT